jgi:hypothetical protein
MIKRIEIVLIHTILGIFILMLKYYNILGSGDNHMSLIRRVLFNIMQEINA